MIWTLNITLHFAAALFGTKNESCSMFRCKILFWIGFHRIHTETKKKRVKTTASTHQMRYCTIKNGKIMFHKLQKNIFFGGWMEKSRKIINIRKYIGKLNIKNEICIMHATDTHTQWKIALNKHDTQYWACEVWSVAIIIDFSTMHSLNNNIQITSSLCACAFVLHLLLLLLPLLAECT